MSGVMYSNGWGCCVTYQPEGKMVLWEESYGVVLEIATFATPIEAKTDASDLLTNSAGYSTYTKNLCLFFYDHSISKAHLTGYTTGRIVCLFVLLVHSQHRPKRLSFSLAGPRGLHELAA
jgi:hypothetical protein